MAILEVQDIHTYYGDAYVLQGLSLKLEQGQILGLLGRNGVGKTTLVNSIVGFNRPRRGKVFFKGVDITEVSSFETVRSGMGLVPQGRRVFPTLSVEENLMVAERSVDRRGWNMERAHHHPRAVASYRAVEGGRPLDFAGRTERLARAATGRLRARDEQGPGGLFRAPGRAASQRRNQIEVFGNLTASSAKRRGR